MSHRRFLAAQGGIAQIGLNFLQTASFRLGNREYMNTNATNVTAANDQKAKVGPTSNIIGKNCATAKLLIQKDDRTDPTAVPRTLRERFLRQSARTPIPL